MTQIRLNSGAQFIGMQEPQPLNPIIVDGVTSNQPNPKPGPTSVPRAPTSNGDIKMGPVGYASGITDAGPQIINRET